MEGDKKKRISPSAEVFWSSPVDLFSNHLHSQKELISTPDVSAWPVKMDLENSTDSSKTDRGYCSLTPQSVESIDKLDFKKCHICRSQNYVQSTPNCTFHKNCPYENQSIHLDHMEPMTETRFPHAQPDPNVSAWPVNMDLENSKDSSKTDSGYCSLTPQSAESIDKLDYKKCHVCRSENYVQSTPNCTFHKNCSYENQSIHLDHMEPITESRLPHAQTDPFLVKRSSTLDLYDDAMDSSLYEIDVEQPVAEYSQECILDPMEISEEKSIDFTDSALCLPNTSGVTSDTIHLKEKLDSEGHGLDSDEYFSPEANLLMFNVVSSKIRNESTPKTVKTCGTFFGVTKKICTINRVFRFFNLNGIEKVDFFYQLGYKKNCPGIISKIFEFLSDKDLDSVRVVCKTWNKLFLNDMKAYNRWKLYNTTVNMKIENCYLPIKTRGSEGRLTLTNITNQNSPSKGDSPRHSPPVSPRSVRFHSYQKAAKNLKPGERLLPCPRCHFPSHDTGSPSAQCSRSGCRHKFCVWCRNEILSDIQHNCPPLYNPVSWNSRSKPRVHHVGSKNSRRNLRRL